MKSRRQCCYCNKGKCTCDCHRKLTKKEIAARKAANDKEIRILIWLIILLGLVAAGLHFGS